MPIKNDAKMTGRNLFAVNRIGWCRDTRIVNKVGDHLMAEKVEIDPAFGLAPDGATEPPDIEIAGLVNIADGKCEMEWGQVFCQFMSPPLHAAKAHVFDLDVFFDAIH